MHFKRLLCVALSAYTALSCTIPAQALTNVSTWAQPEVLAAKAAGLEPQSLENEYAASPITRAEFCEIALKLYESVSGKKAPKNLDKPFRDTTNPAVSSAYALGLVSGRGNGVFDPSGPITRQELCKMLDNILTVAGSKSASANPNLLSNFSDKASVASWAADAVIHMLGADILRGVSRAAADPTGEAYTMVELKPSGTTTREQALICALRFAETYSDSHSTPSVSPGPDSDTPSVEDPDGEDSSTEEPKEAPPSKQEENPQAEEESPEPEPPVHTDDAENPDDSGSLSIPETEDEKMAYVFGENGSFFETPEIAEAAMIEISIPVWRLKDGKKVSDKAFVTVNRRLAAIYTQIFIEIYNGEEKFPISDVGSYAWRASPTSEHRWGTAIDINADANMECNIDEDGNVTAITCGTHWTPGEDPYSIPEDGEVYRIFEKYGFSWGGNAWTSKRDYMHFSFFGR